MPTHHHHAPKLPIHTLKVGISPSGPPCPPAVMLRLPLFVSTSQSVRPATPSAARVNEELPDVRRHYVLLTSFPLLVATQISAAPTTRFTDLILWSSLWIHIGVSFVFFE